MKKPFKLIFFFLFSLSASAQNENYDPPQGLNNWYVELGGSALFYSINYEKYLYRNRYENLTWVARVGTGFNPIDYKFLNKVFLDRNSFMFPFTSSVLIGSGKEKLELGTGFTMLTKNFKDRELVPNLILGLRVMESNSVCFRLSYIPLLRNETLIHWVGVSIGKNFNFK
ncbi:MAG: hypothetical protein Q8M15_09550 [Bacteroidota bacterium]|nr:hypothetical protein [Bacteroidota bacterium]